MIAVCCALPQELNPLISCVNVIKKFHYEKSVFFLVDLDGQPVTFVQTGIGKENAVKATHHLFQSVNINTVVSSGVAGGLRGGIHVGDLIFGNTVGYSKQNDFVDERLRIESAFSSKGELVKLALKLGNRLGVKYHCGNILTVDKVIERAETKRTIGSQNNSIAVDMESAGIAQIVHDYGKDFVVIRSISDDVDDDLSIDSGNLITETGKVKISNLAMNIVRDPHQLANLRRLNKQTKRATRSLSAFLMEYIPLLNEKET